MSELDRFSRLDPEAFLRKADADLGPTHIWEEDTFKGQDYDPDLKALRGRRRATSATKAPPDEKVLTLEDINRDPVAAIRLPLPDAPGQVLLEAAEYAAYMVKNWSRNEADQEAAYSMIVEVHDHLPGPTPDELSRPDRLALWHARDAFAPGVAAWTVKAIAMNEAVHKATEEGIVSTLFTPAARAEVDERRKDASNTPSNTSEP